MLSWRSSGDSSDKHSAFHLILLPLQCSRRRTPSSQAGQMGTHVLRAASPARRGSAAHVKSEPLCSGEREDCHHPLLSRQGGQVFPGFRGTSSRAEWTRSALQPCKVPPSTTARSRRNFVMKPWSSKGSTSPSAPRKRPAATFSQDDGHKQPMTGQVLSTSPSIATPTADDELSRPSVHHVAAAAAPVGRSFRMSTIFLHGLSVRNEWLRLTTLGMQVSWQSLIMISASTILTPTTAATPEKRRCQRHPRHDHARCHAPTVSVQTNITCSLFGKATHDRAWLVDVQVRALVLQKLKGVCNISWSASEGSLRCLSRLASHGSARSSARC